MQLQIGDLFANPDHYLFAFDGEEALFTDMDRASYERSIFFDRRISAATPRILRVSIKQLFAHSARLPSLSPRIGWIFHIAHCGSTLLARALDRGGPDLMVREPVPLRQLGIEAAAVAPERPPKAWAERLDVATKMLGRTYGAGARSMVKANVPVNFIVDALMAPRPDAPVLFLYFPLDQYLLAILRTPDHRAWVEMIGGELRRAIAAEVGDVSGLSTPQLAGALWLAQLRLYAAALDRYEGARSLDAETLFNRPAAVLAAAFPHFGLAATTPERAAILRGPLFATYSKNPRMPFDNEARLQRQDALKRALAEDVETARAWVQARLRTHPLVDRLPKPLTGESPLLFARP